MELLRRTLAVAVLIPALFGIGSGAFAQDTQTQRPKTLERIGSYAAIGVGVPGFEELSLKEKILVYYLAQASLAGRDITYDQIHRYSLEVRELFEAVVTHSTGIPDELLGPIEIYLGYFWINNGAYELSSSKKFVPELPFGEFLKATRIAEQSGAVLVSGETLTERATRLRQTIFDASFEPTLTDKTSTDYLIGSAVNYYGEDVTLAEVNEWASAEREKNQLNSRVVRRDSVLVEEIWRAGSERVPRGVYAGELERVIFYLEKAIPYASSPYQAETIRLLVHYLRTGDLGDFHNFNVHWVRDSSNVDFILGFIESYQDPRAFKGLWEGVVYYRDPEQTRLMEGLATEAQYFEDRQPWDKQYRKSDITPPIAAIINVVLAMGDAGPRSPIGINLPNEQSIRENEGSKSITLGNLLDAYRSRRGTAVTEEFVDDEALRGLYYQCGDKWEDITVALHEVIGHGSGRVNSTLTGDPSEYLPGYYGTIEEGRADLVALYHMGDPKLIDVGFVEDEEELACVRTVAFHKAFLNPFLYSSSVRGDQIEQDHAKERQMTALYLLENSTGVKAESVGGETYFRIVDPETLHQDIGRLLAEVMRIKAEGDLEAARRLVDTYGLKVNAEWRDEAKERFSDLPDTGYPIFVMPRLVPIWGSDGTIVDVVVEYPESLREQMLEWSKKY